MRMVCMGASSVRLTAELFGLATMTVNAVRTKEQQEGMLIRKVLPF